MTTGIKRVEDLPQLHVSAVTSPPPGRGISSGNFEISGRLSRLDCVRDGSSFLLGADEGVLIALAGELRILDAAERTALFSTDDAPPSAIVGSNLTYVSGRWEPHHVWMVTQLEWKWKRAMYEAADAIGRKVRDNKATLLEGQEVWDWIEIRKLQDDTGSSRFYPVFPDGRTILASPDPYGVILRGWDHEHCEICEGHVKAGEYGYIDLGKHWICEMCYDKYVVTHDLSFISS